MKLQENFIRSVRLYFKEKGEAWLQALPNIIHYCEQKWSITMREPYSLSVNYVAPARFEDGTEVVVKICIPGKGFLDELEALQLFGEKGIVQLVDSDKQHGIIILEKLSPGFTLAEVAEDEEACQDSFMETSIIITYSRLVRGHGQPLTQRA